MSKGIDELKDWAMHNVRLISILPSNKNLHVDTKLSDVLERDVDEKYYLSEERTERLLKEFPRDLPDGVDGFNKADGDVSYALTTRTSSCYLPHHVETSQATLVSVDGLPIREATETGFDIATTGDSVNIQYPESETRRGRVGKGVANTLEANGINQGVVNKDFRIRKLTPKETWRLQGFTDEQFYKAKNDGVSNSQLYKQAGNSVTVNVIDAIAKRL